jgi:hypothetical protein
MQSNQAKTSNMAAFPVGTARENHMVYWWYTGELVAHQKTMWITHG